MEHDVATENTADRSAIAVQEQPLVADLHVEELLVEEISIDGMCGVY